MEVWLVADVHMHHFSLVTDQQTCGKFLICSHQCYLTATVPLGCTNKILDSCMLGGLEVNTYALHLKGFYLNAPSDVYISV